jgi:tetratricopeptide (TPR) repeat protein
VRGILVSALWFSASVATVRADTVLILPFYNLSKSANLNWIGESAAETMRDALASEGIVLFDRDDRVEAYRRLSIRPYTLLTKASVVKIGQAVDAEQVVYGEFELKPPDNPAAKTRGSLLMTARILDLKRLKLGPEFRELGAVEDLASLQRRLTWQVLKAIRPAAAIKEADFQLRYPLVRVDAIENYTRGLLAANPDDQHRFFTQASRLDAHYSQPCFQLGRLLWKRKEYKAAGDWFQKVAPSYARYHEAAFFLGLCRYYSGDFAAAQAAFQLIARIVPLNEVYNNLGAAQSRANQPEALDSFRKALEGDSGDPAYRFNVGYALWKQGKFEEAAANFQAVVDRDPTDAQAALMLSRCGKQSGPRPGDTHTEGIERLKTTYQESAYLQLKAALQPQE